MLFTPPLQPLIKDYEEIVDGVYRSRKSTIDHAGGFTPSASFVRPSIPNGNDLIHGPVEINGQIVEPFFTYDAYGVSVANFPPRVYGVDLPTASSGTDPLINQGSPLLGTRDVSVKGEGGKVWQAALASSLEVTTESLFFDCVFRHNVDSIQYLFAKWSAIAGYWANTSTTPNNWLQVTIRGPGGTYAPLGAAGSLVVGNWYYAAAIINVNGDGQIYMMNVASGGSPPVSAAGDLTTTGKFTVGALSGFTGKMSSNLAFASGYKKINWFDTHLYPDFIADRCATLIGYQLLHRGLVLHFYKKILMVLQNYIQLEKIGLVLNV
jgi:hypothetical protein